ncbi:MAG: zinc ribbon domain-containing protein [Candidatus Heimdallarchaeaceae archaeon]
MSKSKFCTICGEKNNLTANFCRNCGSSFSKIEGSEKNTHGVQENSSYYVVKCSVCNSINFSSSTFCSSCGIFLIYDEYLCSKCLNLVKNSDKKCFVCGLDLEEKEDTSVDLNKFYLEEQSTFLETIKDEIEKLNLSLDFNLIEDILVNSLRYYPTVKILMTENCPEVLLRKFHMAGAKNNVERIELLSKKIQELSKNIFCFMAMSIWGLDISLLAYFWNDLKRLENCESDPTKEKEVEELRRISNALDSMLESCKCVSDVMFTQHMPISMSKGAVIHIQEKNILNFSLLLIKAGISNKNYFNYFNILIEYLIATAKSKIMEWPEDLKDDYVEKEGQSASKYYKTAFILSIESMRFFWKSSNNDDRLLTLLITKKLDVVVKAREHITVDDRLSCVMTLLRIVTEHPKYFTQDMTNDKAKSVTFFILSLTLLCQPREIRSHGKEALQMIQHILYNVIGKTVSYFVKSDVLSLVYSVLAFKYDDNPKSFLTDVLEFAKTNGSSKIEQQMILKEAADGLRDFEKNTKSFWAGETALLVLSHASDL